MRVSSFAAASASLSSIFAACTVSALYCSSAWRIRGLAVLIGTHMPMLSMLGELEYMLGLLSYFSVGMPCSWPSMLNMPPPELPLEMAASVWIMLLVTVVLRP